MLIHATVCAQTPFYCCQVEIIRDLPGDAIISCYRCGPMVDLCHGPHVPSTAVLKACAVNSMSRAFWRADVNKEPLQVGGGGGGYYVGAVGVKVWVECGRRRMDVG